MDLVCVQIHMHAYNVQKLFNKMLRDTKKHPSFLRQNINCHKKKTRQTLSSTLTACRI